MIEKSVALQEAFNDTWIYEGYEGEVEALSEKYGELDEQTLRLIAHEGQAGVSICTLYARQTCAL